MANSPLLHQLFFREPAGRFALGHVFHFARDFSAVEDSLDSPDAGRWSCDLDDNESLTWSDKVYELFGLAPGSAVVRAEAVALYSDRSKGVLERVRNFAIGHKCAFILDASLSAQGGKDRWIRVIAFPVLSGEKIVGLQGLKRAL